MHRFFRDIALPLSFVIWLQPAALVAGLGFDNPRLGLTLNAVALLNVCIHIYLTLRRNPS